MRFTPHDKSHYPIVPEQFRCVWMTAGILSYQLCDRRFECEDCPLDGAMRMHFTRQKDHSNTTAKPPQNRQTLEKYLYSRNHCWVRRIRENLVRVGIEPGLASLLLMPKTIALPSRGDKVSPHEPCCWIILDNGTISICAPVEGRIAKTNARIVDEPRELRTDPLTRGWLFEIEVDQSADSGLLKKDDAGNFYATDFARFNDLVIEALRGNYAGIGMTLQDGGQALQDVSVMLGPKRYCELVRKVFASPA